MTGHRVAVRDVVVAERITIETASIIKTTNRRRCRHCGQPVTLRVGPARDTWVHGEPAGVITVVGITAPELASCGHSWPCQAHEDGRCDHVDGLRTHQGYEYRCRLEAHGQDDRHDHDPRRITTWTALASITGSR